MRLILLFITLWPHLIWRMRVGKIILVFVLAALAFGAASAQKRNERPEPKKPVVAATPVPTPEITPARPKKNERPASNGKPAAVIQRSANDPKFRYEFTQPDFIVSRIVIEHDDEGKGTIAFQKRSFEETLTEPIEVSPLTLEKLKAAFAALNFLDSTENYQFERDFSNMGNVAITLKDKGRERTARYNWTANKDAKTLMDEYRKIANQTIWMFDINVARENQPLETPKLVAAFDSLLKRNEIADPNQMLPFLVALSNDERIPLIGRNHAGKIVKQIEKQKKNN